MKPLRTWSVREALSLARAAVHYPFVVLPLARRELRRWEHRARRIPDPVLRAHALAKLADESLNPEAAAVFSLLAPLHRARRVIRLNVAFQVLYDYLDTVGEQPVSDPLRNGRALHQALIDAVDLTAPRHAYYRYHPQGDDGGYIEALITTCHTVLIGLPAHSAVAAVLDHATRRCAEGQTRTNAAAPLGMEQLQRWTVEHLSEDAYYWWEVAAGAAASLSVLAILAASADRRTTTADAARIDAAYHPAICALTTLLDSLIDYARDGAESDHRYLAYYAETADMELRLVAMTRASIAGARRLPRAPSHAVLVAGIAAFYLSTPEATSDFARPIAEGVIQELGAIVTVPLAVMRTRRKRRAVVSRTPEGGAVEA